MGGDSGLTPAEQLIQQQQAERAKRPAVVNDLDDSANRLRRLASSVVRMSDTTALTQLQRTDAYLAVRDIGRAADRLMLLLGE